VGEPEAWERSARSVGEISQKHGGDQPEASLTYCYDGRPGQSTTTQKHKTDTKKETDRPFQNTTEKEEKKHM